MVEEVEQRLFTRYSLLDSEGYLFPPGHKNINDLIELEKNLIETDDFVTWKEVYDTIKLYDKHVTNYEEQHYPQEPDDFICDSSE